MTQRAPIYWFIPPNAHKAETGSLEPNLGLSTGVAGSQLLQRHLHCLLGVHGQKMQGRGLSQKLKPGCLCWTAGVLASIVAPKPDILSSGNLLMRLSTHGLSPAEASWLEPTGEGGGWERHLTQEARREAMQGGG